MAELIKWEWIRSLAPGKTFADIGGLGGNAINEMVSVALKAGAVSAAMVDVLPLDHPFWQGFHDSCKTAGVSGYQCEIGDLTGAMKVGPWDVVHCSGVIYHLPDPLTAIVRLRALVREHLILTSMIVPSRIQNGAGTLVLPQGTSILVPAISGRVKAICAEHLDSLQIQIHAVNMDEPPLWWNEAGQPNYVPWWWLFTEEYVAAMLEAGGFVILTKEETWSGRAVSFICRPD